MKKNTSLTKSSVREGGGVLLRRFTSTGCLTVGVLGTRNSSTFTVFPVFDNTNMWGSSYRRDKLYKLAWKEGIFVLENIHTASGKQYECNWWKVWSNGTTSMPKSIPRLVLDKVRFLCSDLRLLSPVLCLKLKSPIKVFHKSWTMFYFVDVVVVQTNICKKVYVTIVDLNTLIDNNFFFIL